MTIIVTYLLIDSVSEQEKEFGALSAVADWVKGIGEDMFTSIEISNGYDNNITDFQTMHDIVQANKESEYQAYTRAHFPSEEAIRTEPNTTPIGFASWCWGAEFGYDDYQGMATERGIPPLNKADFEYICNWWNNQWNDIEKAKIQY